MVFLPNQKVLMEFNIFAYRLRGILAEDAQKYGAAERLSVYRRKIYFITDQTNETTHPKTVQPKSRFNKNITGLFLCCLKNAIRVGKK